MVAHDLSDGALRGGILVRGRDLVDGHGRVLLLRGVNVAGISKLPSRPDGLHDAKASFERPEDVSFVGRPFPLEEAPSHFDRLRAWGHTLVRLLITWEAISPAGPYPEHDVDREYVAYLVELVRLMGDYGIKCTVCPHQDVWSRLCGGSGAPAWTLRAAGFNLANLQATGAAYAKDAPGQLDTSVPENEETSGPFLWPSGYQKLAPATMATLFWGGRVFAPQLNIKKSLDGRPLPDSKAISIQDYLQGAFIEAFGQLADALSPLEACTGFELLNEPHRGYINLHSWNRWKYETDLHIGHFPSPLQGVALGAGHAVDVPFYVKSWPVPSRIAHYSTVNLSGHSAWAQDPAFPSTRTSDGCLWEEHGVWAWDETKRAPVVLQGDYFNVDARPGYQRRPIEWYRDFYAPFALRFDERIKRAAPESLMLVEPIPNEFQPPWRPVQDRRQRYAVQTYIDAPRPRNMVYSPHFYDLNVLFFKQHGWMSVNVQGLSRGLFLPLALYFGTGGLLRNYLHQLGRLCSLGRRALGDVPILVSEVGIPYDVNDSTALRDGNYSVQHTLLSTLISALDRNLISFTLWNYNPANTADEGDGWNKEDFSIINLEKEAADQANKRRDDPLYAGGRTLGAILRPYACKVAGEPISTSWDERKLRYSFVWRNGRQPVSAPTEVYVPDYVFRGCQLHVSLSDGRSVYRPKEQTLYVEHANTQPGAQHWVSIATEEQAGPWHMLLAAAILAPALAMGASWWLYSR